MRCFWAPDSSRPPPIFSPCQIQVFFPFLSDSEGNGKKLDLPPRPKGVAGALKTPNQKPLKNPSTAQIRRKSAANSRKSAQNRPPFCKPAPFRPTRPHRQNDENCKSVRPAVPPLKLASPPSSPSIKPSVCRAPGATRRMAMNASKSQSSHLVSRLCW